jgi:hypothetical protein
MSWAAHSPRRSDSHPEQIFSFGFRADLIGFSVKDVGGGSRLANVLNAIIHPDDLDTVNAASAMRL